MDSTDELLLPISAHRITDHTNVYECKMRAILRALQIIKENKWQHCDIFTDSQADMKSFNFYRSVRTSSVVNIIQHGLTTLVDSGKQISLRWISRHHGMHGNEIADRAAEHALCYPFVDAYEKLSLDSLEAKVTFKKKIYGICGGDPATT